jgi:hypothetical protein
MSPSLTVWVGMKYCDLYGILKLVSLATEYEKQSTKSKTEKCIINGINFSIKFYNHCDFLRFA